MHTPLQVALRGIIETASEITRLTGVNVSLPRRNSPLPVDLPQYTLPNPPSLYPKLVAFGLSSSLADKLSRRYLRLADDLRSQTKDTIYRTLVDLRQTSSLPISERGIVEAYRKYYLNVL